MIRSGTLTAPTLRALSPADRDTIEQITRRSEGFRPDEINVAMEVFDTALGIGRRADPDYELIGAILDGALVGWACWGPTPCTIGTFDLYWIVVDRASQGKGIGSALIEEMERQVAGRARLIVVETAGRQDYQNTRAFYQRRGYAEESRIADYYGAGDDLVVFTKRVSGFGSRDSESRARRSSPDPRSPSPEPR